MEKTKKGQANKKAGTKATTRVDNPVNVLKNMATENKTVIIREILEFQSHFHLMWICPLILFLHNLTKEIYGNVATKTDEKQKNLWKKTKKDQTNKKQEPKLLQELITL